MLIDKIDTYYKKNITPIVVTKISLNKQKPNHYILFKVMLHL